MCEPARPAGRKHKDSVSNVPARKDGKMQPIMGRAAFLDDAATKGKGGAPCPILQGRISEGEEVDRVGLEPTTKSNGMSKNSGILWHIYLGELHLVACLWVELG